MTDQFAYRYRLFSFGSKFGPDLGDPCFVARFQIGDERREHERGNAFRRGVDGHQCTRVPGLRFLSVCPATQQVDDHLTVQHYRESGTQFAVILEIGHKRISHGFKARGSLSCHR